MDGLIWTDRERAAMQAFFAHYKSQVEVDVVIWRLEREIGLQEALECFQKVLDSGREEMEQDVMGCQDCWVHSDIVYCERVSFIPTIPITTALLGRTVIVLLPSTVRICLPLIHNCIITSFGNGFGFSPPFDVTDLLASV